MQRGGRRWPPIELRKIAFGFESRFFIFNRSCASARLADHPILLNNLECDISLMDRRISHSIFFMLLPCYTFRNVIIFDASGLPGETGATRPTICRNLASPAASDLHVKGQPIDTCTKFHQHCYKTLALGPRYASRQNRSLAPSYLA